MPRRVVITSIGIASPIGIGVDEFWAALRAGQNGVEVFDDGDMARMPPAAGGRVAVPMAMPTRLKLHLRSQQKYTT